MSPIILLIETATDVCSVAIADGSKLLSARHSEEPFAHARMLSVLIKECMSDAQISVSQLSAVAVSSGPGSYTALRVGTSVAKGLCHALGIPLISVDTLQSLAMAAVRFQPKAGRIISVLDARKNVYAAIYGSAIDEAAAAGVYTLSEELIKEWIGDSRKVVFVGNGVKQLKHFSATNLSNVELLPEDCNAVNLVSIAEALYAAQSFVDLAGYTPLYLRPPHITKPKKVF